MTKFFFPQKESVVDAFKNFEGSEEEKNSMQGYITRAKMTDKAHASLGGINVVPDEDNKKLLITEMIGEGEKKVFVCHRCSDLTTLNNARSIDYEELKKNACNHSKLSEILFGDTKEARWQEECHRCCKELIGTHCNCLPLRRAWKKTRCDPDYFKKQTAQV